MRLRLEIHLLAVSALPTFAWTQGAASPLLELRAFERTKTVTMAALEALRRDTVSASAQTVSGAFTGVSIADLLRLLRAPPGDSLRGRELEDVIVFDARDTVREQRRYSARPLAAIRHLGDRCTSSRDRRAQRLPLQPVAQGRCVAGELAVNAWERQLCSDCGAEDD